MSNAMLEIRDAIFNLMDDIDGESTSMKGYLKNNLVECIAQIPRQADKELLQAFIKYIKETQ